MLNSFGRYRKAHRSPRRGTTKFMMLLALATAAMLAVMPSATAAVSAQPAASADSAKSEQPATQEPAAEELAAEPAEEPVAQKPAVEKSAAKQLTANEPADDNTNTKQPRSPKPDADVQAKQPRSPKDDDAADDESKEPRSPKDADDSDEPLGGIDIDNAEPSWVDHPLECTASWWPRADAVDYVGDPPKDELQGGDTVNVTGTITDGSDSKFSDGTKQHTWTYTYEAFADSCDSGAAENVVSPSMAEPDWIDATCDSSDVGWGFPADQHVDYLADIPYGDAEVGDTVEVTGTINDPVYEFPDGATEHTWTHEFKPAGDCDEPTVIDAPNGDLPVDDPCGPDNATWILPTGDDVPVGFAWKVAADGLLTAEADEGNFFDVPGEEVFQKVVEYGYAPDSGEPCPVADDPKDHCDLLPGIQSEDDNCSTPLSEKAGFIPPAQVDPPVEADPVADQPDVVNGALPNTGGPDVMAGLLVMALLGIGGSLVLTGRMRRRA